MFVSVGMICVCVCMSTHTTRNDPITWNQNCSIAKNRVRFWHNIWNSCNRPREGYVYSSYKLAKKTYRKVCNTAVNVKIYSEFNTISNLHLCKRSGKMWNLIRTLRRGKNNTQGDIEMDYLEKFYSEKFNDCNESNETIAAAGRRVSNKVDSLKGIMFSDIYLYEERLSRYIHKMKLGSAHGIDVVSSEHIKYASNCTQFIHQLSILFTICLKFGIVPDSFTKGLIIPILKKPTCNPSIPNNYRPVVISTSFSKLMEMFILEECNFHDFHDSQFGFVQGRGTNMAISLTHDVISYNVKRGSPIFACSLDAEGAFDAIPHYILFDKAINVIPDPCWRVLYFWYKRVTAQVRWNNCLSNVIRFHRGTRQGGISSPFLFNIFYQDLIDELSTTIGGINICNCTYNVFCYADDILLTSTTITGLQRLIDVSERYISAHGLRFNPTKTQCIVFGKNNFINNPKWTLNNTVLEITDEIMYLGASLSKNSSNHVNSRIKACRRAFYSLQSAGLCKGGLSPGAIADIWKVALQPVLLYATQSMSLRRSDRIALELTQSRLVKSSLGLSKFCKNTPLFQALDIQKISDIIDGYTLNILKSHFNNDSRSRKLYACLLKKHSIGEMVGHNDLITRSNNICQHYNISMWKFVFDDKYSNLCKRKVKCLNNINDGLSDSIQYLLNNYNDGNRKMLQMLLSPF